ncbi:hypothetical protein [Candidatus Halobonum tyrrellensis]|uniref:hypothetical protein n=1 Tax=Candidatus Halobonum tyrrellensis TaxID=1431545 RepID=UPI0013785D84|nr:hypothetical protein [Candidatus Halobonum tyrrellensis]
MDTRERVVLIYFLRCVEPPSFAVEGDRRLLAGPITNDRDGLPLDRGDIDSVACSFDGEFDVLALRQLLAVNLCDAWNHRTNAAVE